MTAMTQGAYSLSYQELQRVRASNEQWYFPAIDVRDFSCSATALSGAQQVFVRVKEEKLRSSIVGVPRSLTFS